MFFYHLCPLRLASGEYILSYFFKLPRVLSLKNACWISSDLYISTCVGKMFQFMVFIFQENALNLCIFTNIPVPHSKLQVEFFENLFPPRQKGLEEAMICSVKIQSENMKMTWNISLFPFGMIAIFLNVMTLQLCKQYQIVWY